MIYHSHHKKGNEKRKGKITNRRIIWNDKTQSKSCDKNEIIFKDKFSQNHSQNKKIGNWQFKLILSPTVVVPLIEK